MLAEPVMPEGAVRREGALGRSWPSSRMFRSEPTWRHGYSEEGHLVRKNSWEVRGWARLGQVGGMGGHGWISVSSWAQTGFPSGK